MEGRTLSGQGKVEKPIGITVELPPIHIKAVIIIAAIWAILTVAYLYATQQTGFSADNFARVAGPMAAACVALFVAWNTTVTSATERVKTAERHLEAMAQRDRQHEELVQQRENQHQELLTLHRTRLAYDMLRTLDEPNRVDTRIEIRRKFHSISKDLPAIKKKLTEEPDLETKVTKMLGSLEDLAVAARLGHADETILYASFGGVVVKYHAMFALHIEDERESSKMVPPVYCEVEALAKAWASGKSVITNKPLPLRS